MSSASSADPSNNPPSQRKEKAKRLGQHRARTDESQDAPGRRKEWSVSFSPRCRGEEGERLVQKAASSFPNRHLPLRTPESRYPHPAFPAPPPRVIPSPAGEPRHSGEEKARTGSPAALCLCTPRCAPAPRGAEWARPSGALARGETGRGRGAGPHSLVQIALPPEKPGFPSG